MYKLLIFLSLMIGFHILAHGQDEPKAIIQKSIQYHDPEGLLLTGKLTLKLTETRPDNNNRKTTVELHEGRGFAKISTVAKDYRKEMTLKKGKEKYRLNGKSKISQADLSKHKLTSERLQFMINYYRYLWLAPLILKDEGTLIDSSFGVVDFFGKTCIQIKVTYEPDKGHDTWYFYFHPKSYALEGYRFYHDEDANDGEYILLSDEVSFGSVTLPTKRQWYTHRSDQYLGSDILDRLSIE